MSSTEENRLVFVLGRAWLMIKNSRASVPTSELTTPRKLTTSLNGDRPPTTATHRLTNAQKEAEEDRTLCINYFERIGKRQRIHEAAVYHHLKYRSKDTLALLVSTFESLYCVEMQTPPPLFSEDVDTPPVDAKAAIARGRALAFTEDPSETEHAWTYNNRFSGEALEMAWAEANPDFARNDTHSAASSTSASTPAINGEAREVRAPFSAEEAKAALDRIQMLAQRLLPPGRLQRRVR
ncbi:hypothetical protein C8F04DRAFT_1268409 [Mycena alexandri]|uniref:Uncharacterized protein n=1 Tax=Mycena alexandri TaxID=1745969 RepID=A0AAD6SEK7_9AGAR|nr:hypothetical protein C8F04DRAFT_1268409 [Mycena alexandri]